MAQDIANNPVSAREAAALFGLLAREPALVLAVSGGPDSTALLWLAARWRSKLKRGPRLIAVTVDHGLRDEAAREARDVCAKHGADLIVNDYWQIAIDEKCTWVHLGQEDLVEADVKALKRAGLKLGVSTHDPAVPHGVRVASAPHRVSAVCDTPAHPWSARLKGHS